MELRPFSNLSFVDFEPVDVSWVFPIEFSVKPFRVNVSIYFNVFQCSA